MGIIMGLVMRWKFIISVSVIRFLLWQGRYLDSLLIEVVVISEGMGGSVLLKEKMKVIMERDLVVHVSEDPVDGTPW